MAKAKDVIDVIDLINCDLVILEKNEGYNTMIVRISSSFINQLDVLLSKQLLNAEISSIELGTGEQTDSDKIIFVYLKERVCDIKY